MPVDALIWPTLLSFFNGVMLCAVFLLVPRARHSLPVQCATWIYIAIAVGLYWIQAPPAAVTRSGPGMPANWLYLLAFASYVPVLSFLCYSLFEAALDVFLVRVLPEQRPLAASRRGRRSWSRGSWSRRLYRRRERRLIARKLRELRKDPEDPILRGDLIDLHLRHGEVDRALYHAYAQVAFLPTGPAHAHALYRMAQIYVDHLGDLESAQPYLRRIIRCYPRDFPANYARRLVNQYEAYADREL